MKRICQFIAFAALFFVVASVSAAGKKPSPVLRMSNGSSDGLKTYYTVWCKNKTIGSVIAEHDQQQYCAMPKGAERRCNKSWNLRQAGTQACQAK